MWKRIKEMEITVEFECLPLNKEGYDYSDNDSDVFNEEYTINLMKSFGIQAEKIGEYQGIDTISSKGKYKDIKKWYDKYYRNGGPTFLEYILEV